MVVTYYIISSFRLHSSTHSIEILALRPVVVEDNAGELPYTLTCIQAIETSCKPMTFRGSMLIISDGVRETHVVDWKTAHSAVLQRPYSSDEPDFEASGHI